MSKRIYVHPSTGKKVRVNAIKTPYDKASVYELINDISDELEKLFVQKLEYINDMENTSLISNDFKFSTIEQIKKIDTLYDALCVRLRYLVRVFGLELDGFVLNENLHITMEEESENDIVPLQ